MMRMTAKLGSHEIIVLVDNGSTHNFVSERIVRLLRMPMVPIEPFIVRVANGENMKCQGWFEGVRVDLQATPFSLTLYSLSLTGAGSSLGDPMARNAGFSNLQLGKLTMEFMWENRARKLQGLGAQSIREASLKELSKELCQKHELFAVCFQLREETVLQENVPPGMQPTMEEYVEVFKEPAGLPPVREFGWHDEAKAAFIALKEAMTSTLTLAMPNLNKSFTIEMDASGDGIGTVLFQQGKPIAFMNQALGITKRSWSTYAKEMLAIVEAIRVWRPYLLGRKFFIQTDHHSLKYFLEQRVATPEQQKWVAKLLVYDYEIIYRLGHENSAADALSRKPNSPILLHIHVPKMEIWEEIRQASKDDA
ncbi:hypothetical protein F0562_032252 [Nyssa sinensis]|uniref:Reverse transcriptase RNase H-like domain-containing protein n=1 Tax=Nyssa sinensis TaxID=561372 RepID=A0A5J5AMK3_9ASTE|nr:hypothetical protein F0562_032252 [Nyssa sinensis]